MARRKMRRKTDRLRRKGRSKVLTTAGQRVYSRKTARGLTTF